MLTKSQKAIDKRVQEIIHLIHEIFGAKHPNAWSYSEWDYTIDIEVLRSDNIEEKICFHTEEGYRLAADTSNVCNYSCDFPQKFLFWDDNKIKAYINKEIEEANKAKERKQRQENKRLKERQKDINKVLQKLSDKDVKVLGFITQKETRTDHTMVKL